MLEVFVDTFIEKNYIWLLLRGFYVTLSVTSIAITIGSIGGMFLLSFQILKFPKKLRLLQKFLSLFSKFYVDLIRGTPVMVQLIFIWLVVFSSSSASRVFVGGVAFGLNSAAYMAEIMRSGVKSISMKQMEAGLSVGLSEIQTFRYIILPQALRNILPAFVNEFISLIKETSILSVIGGVDIMRSGDIMISNTGNAIYPLIIVAASYQFLTSTLTFFMKKLEKKNNKKMEGIC